MVPIRVTLTVQPYVVIPLNDINGDFVDSDENFKSKPINLTQ